VDANGDQVVQAVRSSGYGASAWEDSPDCNDIADSLVDGSGNVTAYGQSVAAHIATGN
jgi:hypothetical protein